MTDDESRNDELETQEGAPLPAREMMSLISADPTDPLGGIGGINPDTGTLPADPGGPDPAPHVPTGGGDVMHTQDADGVSAEPRAETISQSDSASAES
jgi:hypothetical protein